MAGKILINTPNMIQEGPETDGLVLLAPSLDLMGMFQPTIACLTVKITPTKTKMTPDIKMGYNEALRNSSPFSFGLSSLNLTMN